MSKKKAKRAEAPTGAELVEARVIREEDWALEAWRARVTFPEMRRLALRPPEHGGLGYAMSESALRSLVAQARKRHGDTTMTRDERRERQSYEVDARARAARRDLDAAYRGIHAAEWALEEAVEPAEKAAAAKLIEVWQATIDRADRRLAAAHEREAKLHGLDEATRIEAEVTTRDAVTEELNAMLTRAGREPIEST